MVRQPLGLLSRLLGGSGLDVRPGSGQAVELEQVVGGADELPLAVGCGEASAGDGSDLAVVLDLGEDGFDGSGSSRVGSASSGAVDLRDGCCCELVGVTGSSSPQDLVDPGHGDAEFLGGFGLGELTGLDLVDDLGAVLLGLGDLVELAGPAGCDEGLHPGQVDVVLAPVAGVGDDPADPAAFAGLLEVGLRGA